ncbi:MAG: hypothetical protein IKA66_05050 [Candidatus Methanomethylophilaceae archaeon]|nr:hypothetical protein [Candidatus Methanomethylophilaceae archaeon]
MHKETMDGFLASVIAAESVIGSRAVIHGPGGCRTHSTRLSARTVLRDYSIREGPFYFDHPRVPCTYLDEEDYVNGADYKVQDLVAEIDAELVVVIQSPGTSLIGDDLNGAVYRSGYDGAFVIAENNLMSERPHVGYDTTIASMVGAVCARTEVDPKVVNIVGLPVTLEGWESTVDELRSYVEAMGLEVGAFVGAGCTVDELRGSSRAGITVSVLPEYCIGTMEAYRRLGSSCVVPEVPMGFGSTGSWIRTVAEAAGVDPAPALEILSRMERRSSRVLLSGMHEGMKARCSTYSVDLDTTAVAPFVEWLHSYLGMFPEAVDVKPWWDDGTKARLASFLESIGCTDAMGRDASRTRVDVAFADGYSAMLLESRGTCSVGLDLWIPTEHRMVFVDRPVLGGKGALRILDELFQGIQR